MKKVLVAVAALAVVAMFAACGGDKKGNDTAKKDSVNKENKDPKANDMAQQQNNTPAQTTTVNENDGDVLDKADKGLDLVEKGINIAKDANK